MDDTSIRERIEQLVAEEHRLLEHGERRSLTPSDAERLRAIEVELDQYWDLLRQRRARREMHQSTEETELRSPDVVERYRQ